MRAFLLGAAWFLFLGHRLLTEDGLSGDWWQHHLGIMHFINAPWMFPIGAMDTFLWPFRTTVAMSDSTPIYALLIKLFGLGGLPHIGVLLTLHFGLTCAVGAWLLRRLGVEANKATLLALVFVTMPWFVMRIRHDSLCAQWLLLWAIGKRLKGQQAWGAAALAWWVHPYLAIMVHALSPWTLPAGALQAWLLGYFDPNLETRASGFGSLAVDLAAPPNAEGYVWVGWPVVVLAVFGFKKHRVLVPIVLLAVFSVLRDVPYQLEPVADALRSNGRFAWPLLLMLAAWAARAVAFSWPSVIAFAVACLVLAPRPTIAQQTYADVDLEGDFTRIELIPAAIKDVCVQGDEWIPWSLAAAKKKIATNSGYLARYPKGIALRCLKEPTKENGVLYVLTYPTR